MRHLEEAKAKWEETLKQSSSFANLQRAVKFNGPGSPCIAGCRSVCWKAFLLFQNTDAADWSHILLEARNTYSALREHYLKYIKHPELLAELSLDPLADDPDSPWNAVRQDDIVRAEILQDVQRLPDEPLYHQENIQTLILDILFIYCKLNPDMGGYRQGMHELLAPLVYVVHQDAIDRDRVTADDLVDPNMVEMLDSYFIEHDAFALFAKIMEKAKDFYAINGGTSHSAEQSAIVEKSKRIHEVALMRIDPELANHLKSIEILPQIFLIRWVRLLFGREFPFDQLLILWDTIFAFDPTFKLIDLICVGMLIRIRWTLLDADYSVALQLLLKYPAPQPPHGPQTFVDDAVYLKDHYTVLGGASLIMKYTGRTPATTSTSSSQRPSTPNLQRLSLRSRGSSGPRSPMASPGRLIGQGPHGVEALFQGAAGAAKGVIERGEKLGINQAVRDAVGEIRRNMQGLQEARRSAAQNRSGGSGGPLSPRWTASEMERRNKQLAALLDETIAGLKAVVATDADENKEKRREAIDTAAARMEFVKVHLEDSSLALFGDDSTVTAALAPSSSNKVGDPSVPLVTKDESMSGTENMANAEATKAAAVSTPDPPSSSTATSIAPEDSLDPSAPPAPAAEDPMQTDAPHHDPARPAPIPTRSTLAQSSFSWMLEPETTASSSPPQPPSALHAPRPQQHKKKRSDGASRERNAFLFGEVTSPEAAGAAAAGGAERGFSSDDIFGLEPLRKPRARPRGKKDLESLFEEVLSE